MAARPEFLKFVSNFCQELNESDLWGFDPDTCEVDLERKVKKVSSRIKVDDFKKIRDIRDFYVEKEWLNFEELKLCNRNLAKLFNLVCNDLQNPVAVIENAKKIARIAAARAATIFHEAEEAEWEARRAFQSKNCAEAMRITDLIAKYALIAEVAAFDAAVAAKTAKEAASQVDSSISRGDAKITAGYADCAASSAASASEIAKRVITPEFAASSETMCSIC